MPSRMVKNEDMQQERACRRSLHRKTPNQLHQLFLNKLLPLAHFSSFLPDFSFLPTTFSNWSCFNVTFYFLP